MGLSRRGRGAATFYDGVPGDAARSAGTVIVVGAGAAGLSTARVLGDFGCKVIVLEGRDRLGGRLNTVSVGDALVDEGGSWIHASPGNPLYGLVTDAGFTVRDDAMDSPRQFTTFDGASGRKISRTRVTYLLRRATRALERFETQPPGVTDPVANLGERIERESRRIHGATNRRYFRSLLTSMIELTWAREVDELDANAIALNPDGEGKDYVIDGGYSTLIDRLADGLDIHLEAPVESIRYGDFGIVVDTPLGPFEGSHVVVTAPLGVLKANTIAFDPPLPHWKMSAIENIGVGRVEKVALTFERPFWRKKATAAQSLFHVSETPGEFPVFVDTTDAAGCPTLVAFVAGEQAELLTDDPSSFVDRAGDVLRTMFPDRYERPTASHVTHWGSDPFSLGSYSTPAVGVTGNDYVRLAEPIDGRVLFAGEATFQERAGFVEGAIASGIREARRILGRNVDLALPPAERPDRFG